MADVVLEVTLSEPDQYGQKHPTNESPDLIAAKLQELQDELQNNIPQEDKKTYLEALEKCPDLITNKEYLMFLRCEVYNVNLAAQRVCAYWDKRLEIFGPEKAFLPLHLDKALKDDTIAMGRGVAKLLPVKADPAGRNILIVDPSQQDLSLYTSKSMARCVWYMIHAALEDDEETQKYGIILMPIPRHATLEQFDRKLAKLVMTSIRGCLPVRLSAVHVCHPPVFFHIVFPIMKLFLGERLRKRINVHFGSDEHVVERLEKFGLKRELLPTELDDGCQIVLDHEGWLEDRKQKEM